MPKEWTKKEERQYEHVRDSAEERGENPKRAREIGARTVNKNRARAGETKTASRTSVQGKSPQQRGGQHSGRRGPKGLTRDQLYNEAKQRNIKGRSGMSKAQLAHALGRD
ncbi:plasmid stabilization protein [Nocardia niigatensis]|uniref:hypothetical protein n=1 Tax=Nocardia niigatensis TaxID=209249 RepID=UPI000312CDC4|nr:hypothetical protein [Nocardia niigatensis]